MDFSVLAQEGNARVTEVKMNNRTFKTPIIFLGYSFRKNANPTPWKETKLDEENVIDPIPIEGVLVNAYDYMKQKIEAKTKDSLGYKGITMMDSGGFQIQQRQLDLKREEIIQIQLHAEADIAFPMDYPLKPKISQREVNKRIKLTQQNNLYWTENYQSAFINIAHGFELKLLTKQMNKLKEPRFLALGSFVPYLMYSNRRNLIDVIIEFREKYPNTWLHVFGVSHLLATLLFYLGVDSVDSSSWLHNARFGSIHYHDTGPRAVALRDHPPKKAGHRKLTNDEWKEIDCQCPVCKNQGWEWLQKRGVVGLKARGCHNAFSYQQTMRNVKEAITEGKMEEYVKKSFEKSSLKYLSNYSFEKISNK